MVETRLIEQVVYPENVDTLYDLDRLHSFDGAWDTLARIGVASGHVYPLLTEMIEREAQGGEHISEDGELTSSGQYSLQRQHASLETTRSYPPSTQ